MSFFSISVRPLHGPNVDPTVIYQQWYNDVLNVLTHSIPGQPSGLVPYQLHVPVVEVVEATLKEVPQEPVLSAASTAAEIAMAKVLQSKYDAYHEACHKVRLLVLASMGEAMCEVAADPIAGLAALTLQQAMTFVKKEYGTPSQSTLDCWHESTMTAISNPAEFAREMNLRMATYARLANGGQAISEPLKVKQVVASVAGNKLLLDFVNDWCHDHGTVKDRKLEDLVTAVKDRIHSHTSADAGYAGSASSAAQMYTQAQVNAMVAKATSSTSKPVTANARTGNFYCFYHGVNATHKGKDCFYMKRFPQYYPAEALALECAPSK
jgi:hypothetical protein